jgi:PadR family transcriptional regulator PadR
MDWTSQLRKGVVELCVLAVLADGESYGYAILKRLEQLPTLGFSESALYLALGRMQKAGLISSRRRASTSGGPPRRYFELTPTGVARLAEMRSHWLDLIVDMNALLEGPDA